MLQYDSTTLDKLAELAELHREQGGEGIEVYEIVGVNWPEPAGTLYYGYAPVMSVPPPPVDVDVRLGDEGQLFSEIEFGGTVGDSEADLTFWDADDVISNLINDAGEGVRVRFYYWFPQVELMIEVWQGRMQLEDEIDPERLTVQVVQGFRSDEARTPSRLRTRSCNAVWGGLSATQELINQRGCPSNVHIGGSIGNNNPATGQPWTFCGREALASCTARGVNPLFHLSHHSVSVTVPNNQTSGNRLYSTSEGNETKLSDPVRVVMGTRRVRGMPLLAFRRDLNNNNPGHGWFVGVYEACHGPISSISQVKVRAGTLTKVADPFHYRQRLGTAGQTAVEPTMTTHGYSLTAVFRYALGWLNPADVDESDVEAEGLVAGLNDIRVYSTAESYSAQYSSNPVWQIARMICDQIWGHRNDYAELAIESWIAAATWVQQGVRFTDAFGATFDHVRAQSHIELVGRNVKQHIDDMCLAARLSRPFQFAGKTHILPLRALTPEELEAVPVFSDVIGERNILQEEIDKFTVKTTLRISRKSSVDLPNRIEATWDDPQAAEPYAQMPMPPVEDMDAILAAGRVIGDHSQKVNVKKIPLAGVVNFSQATKVMWSVLDLGEFDEGGLANNLRVKFKVWFADAITLHPYQVIKVVSPKLEKYGFEYFRILPEGLTRGDDLTYEITAQAYPVDYYENFEVLLSSLPVPPPAPGPPPGPTPIPGPCVLYLGGITYTDGVLRIEVDECQPPILV